MEDSGINDTDMSLQLDVYEESSEHESDGENSGPENGSDRENSVKESWFLSPKRKWTLNEEVSEEPHGKRIRVRFIKVCFHSRRRKVTLADSFFKLYPFVFACIAVYLEG